MIARAAGISSLNQHVSTFEHTHEPVGRIHLFTQYCPKNSFSSLTLDLLAWWGSWVLSLWTINKTKDRCSKKKARLFYSLPRIDFPTFFYIFIVGRGFLCTCHTQWEGKYTKQWKLRVGTLGASQILPTTQSSFSVKTLSSKQFKTRDLSIWFPAYHQIHPTTMISTKISWTQSSIWVELPLLWVLLQIPCYCFTSYSLK